MSKLQLPTVSLICIDDVDIDRAIKVLERCKQMVDFGAVKLLTSKPTDYQHKIEIMPLNSLIAYSIFMLTKVYQYIDTSHVLIVQRDGFILNPGSFRMEWLKLDYIAPLFVQYDFCGSGGFSLRSKMIMKAIALCMPNWDGTDEQAYIIQSTIGYYEDGVISLSPFGKKFKIASLEEAAIFGQGGNRNSNYFVEYPFGFHRTFQQIDFKTGRVNSTDTTKDLSASYSHEIDKF